MFLSAFLAMLRGFTREILSIMSWGLGALAALLMYTQGQDYIPSLLGSKFASAVIVCVGIFVIVVIIVHLVTAHLSDRILDSRVGAIDRTLGFIFGLGRGFLIVVIAFELAVLYKPKGEMPDWVKGAQTIESIENTRNFIKNLIPDDPTRILPKSKQPGSEKGED
jgi:membrane protein required for colicin V production